MGLPHGVICGINGSVAVTIGPGAKGYRLAKGCLPLQVVGVVDNKICVVVSRECLFFNGDIVGCKGADLVALCSASIDDNSELIQRFYSYGGSG